MLSVPAPSLAEMRDNTAFDALLWSLSRPGRSCDLPEPGEGAIIAALLDRECLVYADDPLLMPQIVRTGANLSNIEKADHVFLGAMGSSDPLAHIAIGTDFYPDDGTTVIIRAKIGSGPALRLTGPGVDGTLTLHMDGLPEGFWKARTARLRYPMGFDLFFVDGARIVGIPRSTTVEDA
ncbi:MAG: phosphonate C-P lyase system protein PhnH [Pseudomonadota bacterium]